MAFLQILLPLENVAYYLQHPSQHLRNAVNSSLSHCLTDYIDTFQLLDQISQSNLSLILQTLFQGGKQPENLVTPNHQDDDNFIKQIKSSLALEFDHIENLVKGPQIIELAFIILSSESQVDLAQLAKRMLHFKLKYLTLEDLAWINENQQDLQDLSPSSTKLLHKKIYQKLLEENYEITSLEEELIVKFIQQGLTTSFQKSGMAIFEGKRYKLRGDNLDLRFEKLSQKVLEVQPPKTKKQELVKLIIEDNTTPSTSKKTNETLFNPESSALYSKKMKQTSNQIKKKKACCEIF